MRFVVVGDATLDLSVRGGSPVPGADRPATIRVGPGGQGANLAVRLARRGHAVRLVTAIGTDPMGSELSAKLAEDGVEVANLGATLTGIVIALLDATGERAMLSDRAPLDPHAWTQAGSVALTDADWIHVSGYPLADPRSGPLIARAVGLRRAGQRASIGGGSFTDGMGVAASLRAARPDLLLFDRDEAALVAGPPAGGGGHRSAEALASLLATGLGAVAVVTDGPAGAAAATGTDSTSVAGAAGPMVDATGAGDAHAAAVLHLLAATSWPPTIVDLRRALERAGPAGAEVAGLVGAQARSPSEGPG